MKYVSDYISTQDISTWRTDQPIVIQANTGTGKSTFVFTELYKWAKENAKRILILVNRTYLLKQFDFIRAGKENTISILSYQSVENLIYYGKNAHIKEFDIIVSDEAHYPFSDSRFNWLTDLTVHEILSTNNCLKIFMSATANIMTRYLEMVYMEYQLIRPKVYVIPENYDHIRALTFYKNDEDLRNIIKNVLKKGEKALFFVNDKERLFNLYKEFESQSIFACSLHKGETTCYAKAVGSCKNDIDILLKKRFLNKPLLFSTSVMDNGISISDDKLHTIICDIPDIDTIVQCLGRKRIKNHEDKLDVYIKDIDKHRLALLREQANNLVNEAEVLLFKGENAYFDEYVMPKNRRWSSRGIVYIDIGHFHINKIRYYKETYDLEALNRIINGYKDSKGQLVKAGWREAVSRRFNKESSYGDQRLQELEEYLAKNKGTYYLSLSDRNALIEKINCRENGHIRRSLKKLNAHLENYGLPYQINLIKSKQFPDPEKPGHNRQFQNIWLLSRI